MHTPEKSENYLHLFVRETRSCRSYHRTGLLVLLAVVFLQVGCGSHDSTELPSNTPIPTILSLSPFKGTQGGAAFVLTVNGSNFESASIVQWNGSNRPTTFVSSTQLTASITAADIAGGMNAQVSVVNPSSGRISLAAQFTILPVAGVNSLSPSSAIVGSAPFILTVNGANFVAGATVQWNGSDRSTKFVSSTLLTATVLAIDVAATGTAQVTVRTPPGNNISNAVVFTINPGVNPAPAITSVVPTSFSAGVTGLALAVNGTNFVGGSIGQWNGANRGTTVLSSGQLLLAPLPEDNVAAGGGLVSVVNPAPGGGTSSSLSVTITAVAPNAVGVTDRVSVADDFSGAIGVSVLPAISADARFIAFQSDATNLVPGDTNAATDVFVRDTCRGAAAGCNPSTIRVSVATDGSQANGFSSNASISADGRFVAFESLATNLISGDTNGANDIFVRDTCVGASNCSPTTTLVSMATDGTHGNDQSSNVRVSANGRYIAFESKASNLVAGDSNLSADIFVRDTCAGATSCTPSTSRVSVATDGSQGDDDSQSSSITADGRFVAFESFASNLISGDTNSFDDIFVRDTCTGATGCTPSTFRVSVDSAGSQGNDTSFLPRISGNGRFVAFTSFASNLVANDTNGGHDVFVRDTCFGASNSCTASTIRISVDSSGKQGDAPSGGPATNGASITPDGRFVAFGSRATNLVSGDTGLSFDIFVRDTCVGATGCTPVTKRVSVGLDGSQGDDRSDGPAITSDGRFVVFSSSASNFVPGNGRPNIGILVARTGMP